MNYHLLIPMAGAGTRFAAAGYTMPKPFIPIGPIPMLSHALAGLYCDRGGHTVAQTTWLVASDAIPLAEYWGRAYNARLIVTPGMAQGAAAACLLASEWIDNDEPLIIANCDQWIAPRVMEHFLTAMEERKLDGGLLTFPASETKWSYARIDAEGLVQEVAEKLPISPFANVGVYYFRCGHMFVDAATVMITDDIRTRGEFYVAPTFNEMILDDKRVGIYNIAANEMYGLGTPEDVAAFKTVNGYV